MSSIWNSVKTSLLDKIPAHSFEMWIEPIKFGGCDNGMAVLSCPNFFSRKRIQENYGKLICQELERIMGQPCQLSVEITKTAPSGTRTKKIRPVSSQRALPGHACRLHSGRLLRQEYTFDHFVVAGNNDFAYSAALSMAQKNQSTGNALYLLSKTGMGKSHLSQAVGHHILTTKRAENVYYMSAEDFTNEMIQAFKNDTFNKFKQKYRLQCDVLLLEDVHYLSGKERTQIELAHTLDTMLEAGKKIIFSSCFLPGDIPKLSDELRSRLSSGLISCIEPPSFKTRVKILKKKAEASGCRMPEDVLRFLASELTEDVRQLESGLVGVNAKSSLLGLPIDLNLAESVVGNISRRRKSITVDLIKKLVCHEYGVAVKDVESRSRKSHIVRPRQVAMYLARRYTDAPLQTIGRSFNRYHATAMHAINAVEKALKSDSRMRRQVGIIIQKLETGDF